MPVELTATELLDTLAVAGEWDDDGAQAARSALEWMGWDGEGPLLLRRYDVQLFVWYTLPRKFRTTLAGKRGTAEALAGALERLGGRAASYAEVCRTPETDRLLRAWEAEDPGAWQRFRDLLDGSGLEPRDTELLAWGQVMGFEEARMREQVATALENAIDAGVLRPGARGFRRRQAEVANRALRAPPDEHESGSRLGVVHAERLEHWLERGHARGSPERHSIIDPIAELIDAEPPDIDAADAHRALAPVVWLIECANDGIALTQTEAINRALVREATERWPAWWNAELHGPPNRETDVSRLHELHGLLRDQRLLRKRGSRLESTARARELIADPRALLLTLATELLAGESFRAGCAELAVALLLTGSVADFSDRLAARIQPAIAAEGWQYDGEPPGVHEVSSAVAGFLRAAHAVGLLEREGDSPASLRPRRPLRPTTAGRAALIAAMRVRALAPRKGP